MGTQGDGCSSNAKQSQFQPLPRQNSMYSLTLDEVQNQLGDLGKPLSSMNLDELLQNVFTAEANHSMGLESENVVPAYQTSLQRQASLTLTSAMSKKTVDEVLRDIQQSKGKVPNRSQERQPTLGEITLEDFLVKAGVVVESSSDKNDGSPCDANVASQFSQPRQWMEFPHPQYQHPQQGMLGVYIPRQPMPQPLHTGVSGMMDAYPDTQMPLPSPLMGTFSDTHIPGRKRGMPEEIIEKTVERRQKRMIKNRESAARSRARKQAYTNELENKVSRLEEENEWLRRCKELEKMLPSVPLPETKYQLRRTSSAPF